MNEKTPFVRLAKRDMMPNRRVWAIRALSFAAAIAIGAVIFALLGDNPAEAQATILDGSLGKKTAPHYNIQVVLLGYPNF